MRTKKISAKDKRLLRLMKISLYDRYILFDRQLSDIIFENKVTGFDFEEDDESIIFSAGYMFEIRKKGNNAVIYSTDLTDYIKNKFSMTESAGVQKLYIKFSDNHFVISKNSFIFLQNTINFH